MKTTLGNDVKVVWVRPAVESDNLPGHIQSIWGVEVNGVMRSEKFISKRAAMQWVRLNYNV